MFLRFVGFFVFVAILAVLLDEILSDRQTAIIAFCILVILASLAMPALRCELNGTAVDTIYYSAVAVAGVMFFIAEEPEQAALDLQKKIEVLKETNSEKIQYLANITNKFEKMSSDIESQLTLLKEAKAGLSTESAQRLMDSEDEIAGWMLSLPELENLAADITRMGRECEKNSEAVAWAWADSKRDELTEPERFDGMITSLRSSEREIIEAEILRCSKATARQNFLNGLESGYPRLIWLIKEFEAEALDGTLPRRREHFLALLAKESEKIKEIKELLSWKRQYESASRKKVRLEREHSALAVDLSETSGELGSVEQELECAKTELKAMEDKAVAGLALSVKDWMTFKWPYFLICLLGLKLARKPVLVLW